MSGTSLDGIDFAYIKFSFHHSWSFSIIHTNTFKYSDDWLNKLKIAFHQNKKQLKALDDEYGVFLADLCHKFINENNIKNIDFIASHGHTIHHKPAEGYTLQIGNGKIIANKTGIQTIYNFRTQDVALGGQGAPLVPIGDELLFAKYDYCLNLGGFANVSYKNNNTRIAFDICAVNTVLNVYANKLGLAYDNHGEIAKNGQLLPNLLKELNHLDFYKQSPPKSLGFEYVDTVLLPLIESYQAKAEDVLHTYCKHIAYQITKIFFDDGKVLITGGGTFNHFLIDEIKAISNNKIVIPSNKVIDYKEALIFAFLGVLKLENKVNCLKSVTGASKNHSSGKIALV